MVTDYARNRTDQSNGLVPQISQLFNKLFDQFSELLNTQVALFKAEVKEAVRIYGKPLVWVASAGLLAILGFALLSVGLAFWLNLYVNSLALSFVIVGLIYLIVGSGVALSFGKKLTNPPPVLPETMKELGKDKEWIRAKAH